MIRPISFIEWPHLNVMGDHTYPAWLVAGLVYADPVFPIAYGLNWGETIIGKESFNYPENLEKEHFSITIDPKSEENLIAILHNLSLRGGTSIWQHNYLEIKTGLPFILRDEEHIVAGGRELIFKINRIWKRTR